MGVGWYTVLENGTASGVSLATLTSIAHAMHLSAQETEYLADPVFRVAWNGYDIATPVGTKKKLVAPFTCTTASNGLAHFGLQAAFRPGTLTHHRGCQILQRELQQVASIARLVDGGEPRAIPRVMVSPRYFKNAARLRRAFSGP